MSREWTIRLPWTAPPLSLNGREHWRAKADKVANTRAATRLVVAHATFGATMPERIDVTLTYYPRDKRRRDADNLVATLKACCDGIVDAGVVADDTPELMRKHMPIVAAPDGDPRLILVIREVV